MSRSGITKWTDTYFTPLVLMVLFVILVAIPILSLGYAYLPSGAYGIAYGWPNGAIIVGDFWPLGFIPAAFALYALIQTMRTIYRSRISVEKKLARE